MIKRMQIVALMALAMAASSASAQNVDIQRNAYGSGVPGKEGFENADVVENDIFHAPQYMAAFPTAATIWPRVVEVPCVETGAGLKCEGYNWTPKMGRGEYLFFKPKIVQPVRPEIIIRETIREVEPKKIRQ